MSFGLIVALYVQILVLTAPRIQGREGILDVPPPRYFLRDRIHISRRYQNRPLALASSYFSIRERPNMLGHESKDAFQFTRQNFTHEASKDTGPAWALDADLTIRPGERSEQKKLVQIRVILGFLVWLSVAGTWFSFPVVGLEESTSRLGPVLLVGSI